MDKKEKRLDIIWAKAIKSRANNRCELCAGKNNLSAHHIINKSQSKGLRWKMDNGICLCFACHRFAHDFPDKFKKEIENIIDYPELKRRGNQVCKYIDLKKEEENIYASSNSKHSQ